MQRYILGYNDVGLEASFSGGVWRSGLDTTMLNRSLLSAVARTSDLSELVLNITLNTQIDVQVLGLCNHNLTSSGTYKWIAYSDAARTSIMYDYGVITSHEYNESLNSKTSCNALETAINTPYWQLVVNDQSNTDGYIQIGRIFIGKRFVTAFNMDYGLKVGVNLSQIQDEQSIYGIDVLTKAIKKRSAIFSSSLVEYGEFDFLKMQLSDGVEKHCLFELDEENKNDGIFTFLGKNTVLSPLDFPSFNVNNISFNLQEII